MTASLDRSVRVGKDVMFRELDGEAVLLNLESGKYYGLDAVGLRIWQFVQQTPLLRSVWQSMQDEFDAPADALHRDLLTFIDELSTEGLITLQ
jgi:coenzyme PQQ synthesis protein D (PqqD)